MAMQFSRLLLLTAEIKIAKYLRNTLNHETEKIFNRENLLYVSHAVAFQIAPACPTDSVIYHFFRVNCLSQGKLSLPALQLPLDL